MLILERNKIVCIAICEKSLSDFELSDAGASLQRTKVRTTVIKLKSLILAQIERWRHALHMQVERQHGGNPGGEWRTGE